MAIEHKTKGDRDGKGRFKKGWKGGPGRPPRPVEEATVETFRKACSAEDLENVIARLVTEARRGSVRAIEVLLRLVIGAKTISEIERELGARDATALARRSDEDMVKILVLDPKWRAMIEAELKQQEPFEMEVEHDQEEEQDEEPNAGPSIN